MKRLLLTLCAIASVLLVTLWVTAAYRHTVISVDSVLIDIESRSALSGKIRAAREGLRRLPGDILWEYFCGKSQMTEAEEVLAIEAMLDGDRRFAHLVSNVAGGNGKNSQYARVRLRYPPGGETGEKSEPREDPAKHAESGESEGDAASGNR